MLQNGFNITKFFWTESRVFLHLMLYLECRIVICCLQLIYVEKKCFGMRVSSSKRRSGNSALQVPKYNVFMNQSNKTVYPCYNYALLTLLIQMIHCHVFVLEIFLLWCLWYVGRSNYFNIVKIVISILNEGTTHQYLSLFSHILYLSSYKQSQQTPWN